MKRKEQTINSNNYEYGTSEYFKARIMELEKALRIAKDESDYYRTQLAKAHEILGRVVHQLSERWDTARLTSYFPTDNLAGKRNFDNPKGGLR